MVEVREVNRVFDEGLFPASLRRRDDRGRQLAVDAVPLLAFYFRSRHLTAEARLAVINMFAIKGRTGPVRRLWAYRSRPRPLVLGDGVTADISPFFRETQLMFDELRSAREMVHIDPDILGGAEPVIRGTRVPVLDVAAAVEAGTPIRDILVSYPDLSERHVRLASLYAKVERPRGRPRRRLADNLPPGARLLSSGRVPRSKAASPSGPEPSST